MAGPRKEFLDQLKKIGPGGFTQAAARSKKELTAALINAMRDRGKPVSKPEIGRMYHYVYNPKGWETLPYYDLQPIVIPIGLYDDGWLGLNFHYLNPYMRAVLLDKLIQAYEIGRSDRARLAISYGVLKSVASLAAFKPCLKRYLSSHVRTAPLEIRRADWILAITLPIARFRGAGQDKIHADSRAKAVP